jgi:hypothetical protein
MMQTSMEKGRDIGIPRLADDEVDEEEQDKVQVDVVGTDRKLRDLSDSEVHQFPGLTRERWW